MSRRYEVEYDGYGYWVIDTTIPDGEPCNVFGTFSRVEADSKCQELNDMRSNALVKTAPLLLQMCELSLEVFGRLDSAFTDEAAKLQLRTLRNTMRKTVALAKSETLTSIPGEKK